MATFELARYQIDPSNAEKLEIQWPLAVKAISYEFPGLIQANLVRLDDTTWIDIWHWESHEAAVKAAEGAPKIPAAAEMFSLISGPPTLEHGQIVKHQQVQA